MALWDADVHIDTDRARGLIDRHFPSLSGVSLMPFGEGWDNVAFLADERWVFRFPRRKLGGEAMRGEIAVLGSLPDLGLAVPRPEFTCLDPDDYPYPFAGYPLIPGRDGDQLLPATTAIAEALGTFLARLHSAPVPEATPRDTLARAALAPRADRIRARLPDLVQGIPDLPWDRVPAVIAAAAAHAPPTRPHLVHGDLYPRHVLVDERDQASGVIDWGDVHTGDPSGDLSIGWTWFHADARRQMLDSYQRHGGHIDAARIFRARFRAIQYATVLIPYGWDRGDRGLVQVGEHAIREAVG